MSDTTTSIEVKTTGPSYLGWRAELLTELALARVPGLIVHRRTERPASELPYGFLVVAPDGFCFFIEARAFSSFQLEIEGVEEISELRWTVEADSIRRARENRSPVVLFLFDADTDHGRYLRLDTIPAPGPDHHRVTVRLPVANTITRESLQKLIDDLRGAKP